MPTVTYEQLIAEMAPQIIETERQYEEVKEKLAALMMKGRARSSQEIKLMRLLALLVEDYDRRHALPADHDTPAERLRFLLEHSAKSPSDLLPVFGQRSHVNEALNGKRAISVEHARKLAKMFGVKVGLFF
jgi:HTH-type transcriptional regulator / antitoxin HigA